MVGIVFGGSAGYFSYYLGVSKYLIENYDLENVKLAGVSGGSIAALGLCLGEKSYNSFVEDVIRSGLNDMREMNTFQNSIFKDGVVGPESVQLFKKKMTKTIQESHRFEKIGDRCTIIATRMDGLNAATDYINDWNSIHELVDCVVASCWVPLIFGNVSTKFRGKNYIDGGIPFIFNSKKIYPTQQDDWIYVDLYTFHRFQENFFQSAINIGALLFTANKSFTDSLIQAGYDDAKNHPEHFIKLKKKSTKM
tara:strand:+ start:6639 stop:7391 length:753 start_codon:yes stop_codon:yes gene_type:complete